MKVSRSDLGFFPVVFGKGGRARDVDVCAEAQAVDEGEAILPDVWGGLGGGELCCNVVNGGHVYYVNWVLGIVSCVNFRIDVVLSV